jgi:large subunit ribosomal protein L17
MFRNQLTALFTHDRIVTTVAKAKELRPLAERMVTLARTGSLPARRRVLTMVPDKEIVRRLFDDIAPRFMDRPGGYTRIMRLGRRRGDGAEMAIIEFVDYDLADHDEGAASSKSKTSLMDRAKGMFGGGAKAVEESAEEPAVEAEAAETVSVDEPAAEPEAVQAAPEEAPSVEPEAVETAAEQEEPAEEPKEVATAAVEEPAEEPEAAATEAAEETTEEPTTDAEAADESDEETKKS